MSDQPESLVDKRIVQRNIQKGKLTKKDHEKYLASLIDVEPNSERVRIAAMGESDGSSEE